MRPIRKKAFHRALRRGDLWAVTSPSSVSALMQTGHKFLKVLVDRNCPDNTFYFMWPGKYGLDAWLPIDRSPYFGLNRDWIKL